MANANRGEVSFEADGKEYTLRFSTNALCELEEKLDTNFIEVAKRLSDQANVRLSLVRAVVWAGLRDRHSEITLEQAGDLISNVGMLKIMQLVAKSFERSFSDGKRGGEGASPRPLKSQAASTS
jgi:hypothetical protein